MDTLPTVLISVAAGAVTAIAMAVALAPRRAIDTLLAGQRAKRERWPVLQAPLPMPTEDDELGRLKARYVRGALTLAQFERSVDRLLNPPPPVPFKHGRVEWQVDGQRVVWRTAGCAD